MSPWRTLQCLRPARSSRARASASMSSDRSRPSPRSISAANEFEHAAGAGAEIEQRADRLVGERRADRVFDRGVGDMELADAVPLGGVAAEIILRGGGARGAHRGEPLAVARDDRIVGIEPRDQRARDIGDAAALAQAEEGPRSFAEALDQAGLGQQPQMAGQPRLRLAQDFGEVGDGQFGLGDEHQDAQPRGFAGGLEGRREGRKSELLRYPWR